ncbi:MAG: ATP-binding protein [Aggregatilineales bacterium]
MSFSNSITLMFNGLILAIAFSFLLIALWQDARKTLNQFFAVFLFMVMVWNIGSLMAQVFTLVAASKSSISLVVGIIDLGFTGSAIAVYMLTASLVGLSARHFRPLAFSGLGLMVVYQAVLLSRGAPIAYDVSESEAFVYQPQALSVLFYLFFGSATFFLTWRYRRKIRSKGLVVGIMLFVIGQTIGLLNPELRIVSLSVNLSSLAALIISFAILRKEIITPLSERVAQIEAMHRVSLAITSQIALDTVLNQIAVQAVGWLDADGSAIFLTTSEGLRLATVYNLPRQFIGLQIRSDRSLAGQAANNNQSVYVENYRRDWNGEHDLPLARETFGSVICVPLVYGSAVIGVLMVISGQQGRLFNRDDVHLLELLGGQAAVAIAHSQLFAEQEALTTEVETARSQLETVLASTENPVIAVDRRLRLLMANPSARQLFKIPDNASGKALSDLIPAHALPNDFREALRNLRRNRTHVYEIQVDSRVYLCHLARLGGPRTTGWVAVLNDITQLKELDRLKSEMVRMTSHDLKNPLQAAMANLELLRDDLGEKVPQEAEESIAAIAKQLERMNRIINGTLDLERIRTGATKSDVCRATDIVESAVDELRQMAAEGQVSLNYSVADDSLEFLGDSEQIKRALVNLVENGIKFTAPGGSVHVSVEPGVNSVIMTVRDTGIGIPQELQGRIFERFFRGQQTGTEHISGSGLGLSLVKAVAENHGGSVWLESQPGAGSTFYVSLPTLIKRPTNATKHAAIETLSNPV